MGIVPIAERLNGMEVGMRNSLASKPLRLTILTIINTLIISAFLSSFTPAQAKPKPSAPPATTKPSAPSATTKPSAPPATTKPSAPPAIKCSPTAAIAHEAVTVTPPTKILKKPLRTMTLLTNCGKIVIETYSDKAPITTTAMSALARGGFFTGTLCHRLTTAGIFVLQCGDPTATGSGGPKFSFRDENLPQATVKNYPEGTVAMANSGPNTNGSQFFLVYGDTTLGPNYTIWGRIVLGLDIVKAIAAAGVKGGGSDGKPTIIIAIEKVKLT